MPWNSRRRVGDRTSLMYGMVALAVLGACGDGGTKPTTTGSLVVVSGGLPTAVAAPYTVRDSEGASRSALTGDTIRDLAPGMVTVNVGEASRPGVGRFQPLSGSYSVNINVGQVTSANVSFRAAPSYIVGAAAGLPDGAEVAFRLTGPDGGLYFVLSGQVFTTSLAGQWTIEGEPVSAGNFWWQPSGTALTRSLLPGDTAVATIPFTVASGAINVVASGLSDLVSPVITATNGSKTFTRVGPGPIPDVPPGTWQITATSGTASGLRYSPAVSPLNVVVSLGALTEAIVPFVAEPVRANLSVEGAYLTQAVQLSDGSAGLVAGRDALLRVFALANDVNDWRPPMRVTLSANGSVLQTLNVPFGAASIDTVISEGVLARSWNLRVDGDYIVPGLRILVQADPEGTITVDDDPDDNVWPRGGVPHPVNVQTVAPWRVVLIPVANTPTSLTGNVTESNKEDFLALSRQLLPVDSVDVRVRATFTSSVAALQSSDGNNAWIQLLGEINALRAAEGAAGEYYYGIVKVNYSSGIAGYGYVPGRAAVGWDYLPGGGRVAAHEWGHNMGRRHAPCGNVSGADPNFPHSGGVIGSWGWNSVTNQLVAPGATDLMGYCGNQWISAFNWDRMLNHRAASVNAMVQPGIPAASAATDRLLVWGNISSRGVTVEPTFLLAGSGSAPEAIDPNERAVRVEAIDAAGVVLASVVTAAPLIDHVTDGSRAFATTLPLTAAQQEQMVSVRVQDLRSPLAVASRRRSVAAAVASAQGRSANPELTTARIADGVRVEWNTATYPRAMVREIASGRILGFLRESGSSVKWSGTEVEVVLSDGVQSRRHARVTRR